ncbi:MAG: fused MFS/spermidine synthase [Isosphaeraceae bacterium]
MQGADRGWVRGRGSLAAVGLLFGLSGIPALIDQVAWERILALHSGVGAVSVTLIVSAFMAGLGIGSQLGGRLSRRLSRRAALRGFAACELTLAVFAWFSGPLYHELPGLDRSWFHADTFRTGLAHFLVLLPPTVLMGMTLPLLVRALVDDAAGAARRIGMLYGLNVVGAAVGAMAAPWVLVPQMGLVGALRFGAACHALAAVGVVAFGRPAAEGTAAVDDPDAAEPPRERFGLGLWASLSFLSGFYAIGLEVVWFRLIDVGVKGTAFTFGTVLSVYLTGLAAGSLVGARRASRWRDPLGTFLACQCGILLFTGLAVVALVHFPSDFWPFDWFFNYWASYEPLAPRWQDLRATFALYGLFPAALFGVPTFLMGLSFTALQRGVQDQARTSGFKVGVLQSANIAGCVTGGLAVGLWCLAGLGTATTLRMLVASGGVLAAFALVHALLARRPALRPAALLAGLAAAALLVPENEALWLRMHGVRAGELIVAEGMAGVASARHEGGERWRISVNGKGQSFVPFGGVHSKLGALPATLHPEPADVAIIGLGSGDTAWAASCRPETRRVSVFEIIADERRVLDRIAGRPGLYRLESFLADPRVLVIETDGRAALDREDVLYDLIEADAIRPNGVEREHLLARVLPALCAAAEAGRPDVHVVADPEDSATRFSMCSHTPCSSTRG